MVLHAGLRLVEFHEACSGHNRAPYRILDGREGCKRRSSRKVSICLRQEFALYCCPHGS